MSDTQKDLNNAFSKINVRERFEFDIGKIRQCQTLPDKATSNLLNVDQAVAILDSQAKQLLDIQRVIRDVLSRTKFPDQDYREAEYLRALASLPGLVNLLSRRDDAKTKEEAGTVAAAGVLRQSGDDQGDVG